MAYFRRNVFGDGRLNAFIAGALLIQVVEQLGAGRYIAATISAALGLANLAFWVRAPDAAERAATEQG